MCCSRMPARRDASILKGDMSSSLLIDAGDPQITLLILNRPEKRNALSIELIDAVRNAVLAAADDPNRRAIIIRGNGPVFCAGLDLNEAADPARTARSAEALAAMYEAIVTSPLVTIAAAQGAAMGGGAGLVAACDFAVASEDLKLGYPEVHRGLVAALVTCLLRRQLGERQVRELILLGQSLSTEQARPLGLINHISAADHLLGDALNLARQACKGAPGAIARTKKLLAESGDVPIAEELRRALRYHLEARHSAEAAEGVAAFREKREPNWPPRQSS